MSDFINKKTTQMKMNQQELMKIEIPIKDKRIHYVVSRKTSRQLEKLRDGFAKELNLPRVTTEQFLTIVVRKLKVQ